MTPTEQREQILVRWSDPTVFDATWEDTIHLKERYHALSAWDQAVSQEGGDVSALMPPTKTFNKSAAMAAKQTTTLGGTTMLIKSVAILPRGRTRTKGVSSLVHLGLHSPTASMWGRSGSTLPKRRTAREKKGIRWIKRTVLRGRPNSNDQCTMIKSSPGISSSSPTVGVGLWIDLLK